MNGRDVGDAVAVTGAFGVYVQFLPEIAAVLAIIWTLVRLYEWARVRIFGKDKDTSL